jgi:lipoate---protein ligase
LRILFSPFQNPFINLALEDHFLRGGADLPILFLYVNRPCVVLGRFQNPWIECHLPYLVENDIWLVRRQSGGGTVFHDEGNLNFSFITKDAMIDRSQHAHLLVDVFKKADISLEVSPRNGLWLKDAQGTSKKISGSAYKQTKFGSFHHGTFLVNSDLEKLEESLKHTLVPSATKSIASVRSKVITLSQMFPHVEIPDVIEIISHGLNQKPQTFDATLLSEPEVQKSFQQLRSWEWLWGETPEFELPNLIVKKGILKDTHEKFDLQTMHGKLSQEDLKKFFPDFSEQHRSSNQIL